MPEGRSLHFFAGAGGDTIAAEMAGIEPVLCANHWTRAVDTHATNYPEVEHVVGDLSIADPKRFRRGLANVLLASPECTYHSSARNWREALRELRPWDPGNAAERSRCTMYCPQRWAEYHRFDFVLMENVVEVCRWRHFPDWVDEWEKIGYRVAAVCANSAFFGAPQSRDRIYFVAWRREIPAPDLEFRVAGWCGICERNVEAVQRFKEAAIRRAGPLGPVGKYGPRAQYLYRCPDCGAACAPYITPAYVAVDWSIEAEVIAEREEPLCAATLERIRRGLRRLGSEPKLKVSSIRIRQEEELQLPVWLPHPALPGRDDLAGDVSLPEGFQLELRGVNVARGLEEPTRTLAASGNHLGLVLWEHAGGSSVCDQLPLPHHLGAFRSTEGFAPKGGGDALGPVVGGEAFCVANYTPGHVRDVCEQPFGTLTAGGQRGVTQQAVLELDRRSKAAAQADGLGWTSHEEIRQLACDPEWVQRCRFRMLEPHECQRVMGMQWRYRRLPDGGWQRLPYLLTGPKRDRVRMTGNAVTPTVEAAILHRCLEALR